MVFGPYVYYDRIRNKSEKLEEKQAAPNLLVFVKKLFSELSDFFSYTKSPKDESSDLVKYFESFKKKIQFHDSQFDRSAAKLGDVLRRAYSKIEELMQSYNTANNAYPSEFKSFKHDPNALNTIREIETFIAILKNKRDEAVQKVVTLLRPAIENNKISETKPLELKLIPESDDKSSLLVTSWAASFISLNYRIKGKEGSYELVLRPQMSDYKDRDEYENAKRTFKNYREILVSVVQT